MISFNSTETKFLICSLDSERISTNVFFFLHQWSENLLANNSNSNNWFSSDDAINAKNSFELDRTLNKTTNPSLFTIPIRRTLWSWLIFRSFSSSRSRSRSRSRSHRTRSRTAGSHSRSRSRSRSRRSRTREDSRDSRNGHNHSKSPVQRSVRRSNSHGGSKTPKRSHSRSKTRSPSRNGGD